MGSCNSNKEVVFHQNLASEVKQGGEETKKPLPKKSNCFSALMNTDHPKTQTVGNA